MIQCVWFIAIKSDFRCELFPKYKFTMAIARFPIKYINATIGIFHFYEENVTNININNNC